MRAISAASQSERATKCRPVDRDNQSARAEKAARWQLEAAAYRLADARRTIEKRAVSR